MGLAKDVAKLIPGELRSLHPDGELDIIVESMMHPLETMKGIIDQTTEELDVEGCDPRFLPLMAGDMGFEFFPEETTEQRRLILTMVVAYIQNKGNESSSRHNVRRRGGEVSFVEGYARTMRLNTQAKLNRQKLVGNLWARGAYHAFVREYVEEVRKTLALTRPFGTRVFITEQSVTVYEIPHPPDCQKDVRPSLRNLLYPCSLNHFRLNACSLNERNAEHVQIDVWADNPTPALCAGSNYATWPEPWGIAFTPEQVLSGQLPEDVYIPGGKVVSLAYLSGPGCQQTGREFVYWKTDYIEETDLGYCWASQVISISYV